MRPDPATQAGAVPGGPPSVGASSAAARGGHSAPVRTARTPREPCTFCGATDWGEAHFVFGRIVCLTCWRGQRPAKAMPPTPSEQRQLALWMAPQPRRAPMGNFRTPVQQ
jgi:hypothetical protein